MRNRRSKTHDAAGTPRRPRRIHEETPPKLPEIAACPGCGASYRNGRWTWKRGPADAYPHTCPACQRVADADPAGEVAIHGRYVDVHRAELIQQIRHVEERERSEHPLKRVMAIDDLDAGLLVTVTDGKLALAIGRALERAHDGKLDEPTTTAEQGNLVRVRWTRE